MHDHKIGRLPVDEDDRLLGMLTDHDIVCRAVAAGADPATTRTAEVTVLRMIRLNPPSTSSRPNRSIISPS